MAAATQTHLLTYEEYLRTPETMRRFEIIDGVMGFMSPGPTRIHQKTLLEFCFFMRSLSRGLGELYVAPLDIIISRRPLRTRQPDILFVSKERLHILKERVEGGPDIVVEILSPSNRLKDVLEKLKDYASIGVQECWMLNTENRTLEIWRNQGLKPAQGAGRQPASASSAGLACRLRPAALYRVGQKVRSKVFPAFTLPAAVFPKA